MPDKYFFLRLPGAILWIVEKLTNVELVRGLIRHKWSQLATDKQIREMESASRLISFEAKAYQSGRDLFRNVT